MSEGRRVFEVFFRHRLAPINASQANGEDLTGAVQVLGLLGAVRADHDDGQSGHTAFE